MSFHGGLVGAVVGGSIVCKASGLSIPTICDLGVIGAPLGLFFGRCANFINGELWGKPTDLPWGVMFETGGAVYRHPSQLYEATLEGLVLFLVVWIYSIKKRPPGAVSGLFLFGYGLARFVVEFFREPDSYLGLQALDLSRGQWLSLPMIIIGAGLWIWACRRKD